MEFSLDGGSTFFITTDPININDISIDGSGDGLLCQSEMVLASVGSRTWYINPEMESIASEDIILNNDGRGWARTRPTTPPNSIYNSTMRREAATGSVEGVFTCEILNDMNPIRSLYVLYPSELLLTHYNNYVITK